ncbi:site-2 protease family protein [Corynebacterium bovis]|uniref:M50 family metallopeptidase n=1 Tax=Corynebacterium bovis TaxID=36808 RepID=UPI00254A6540|nr:site-2 protease family protein [Corynebacterium bovis]MDK8510323.1 site-2 protease family protein [Corynebacterium bovis]
MAFALGVVLFVIGIAVTIGLHEAGHMQVARWCGMRVRRFFIGFGPTVWSFRRGGTEYGLKAVPVGGFCDIAGMTTLDPVTADELPDAMYGRPWWQRVCVLVAGVVVNVLLGLVIVYAVTVVWGLPNPSPDIRPVVGRTTCVPVTLADATAASSAAASGGTAGCTGAGPAAESGVRAGDRFVRIDGRDTPQFGDVSAAVAAAAEGHTDVGSTVRVPATVERDGRRTDITLSVLVVERAASSGASSSTSGAPGPGGTVTTGAIGVVRATPENLTLHYNPVTAVGGTASFTGTMVSQTVSGIISLPARFPGVVESIFGGQRATDSPMSVVGASRAGGELVQHDQWQAFALTLASLNFFLAGLNLVPLPPLDGGHAVVVLWERLRDAVRRRRGLPPGGPADYRRLMPVTYVAAGLLLVFGVTVIVADVVNPVRLFP